MAWFSKGSVFGTPRFSYGFKSETTSWQLLRKSCVCRLLLLCVLGPVLPRPVLGVFPDLGPHYQSSFSAEDLIWWANFQASKYQKQGEEKEN